MKSRHIQIVASTTLAAALVTAPCTRAAGLLTQKKLSLDVAQTIAQGALEACRANGDKVAVLVVDDANLPKVMVRDDGSQTATVDMVRLKANTVMAFGTPSDAFAKMGAPIMAHLTIYAGGLPIKADGQLIGAVAVSGAAEGAKDAACAQAGLAKAGKLE
jgi:uncharacterized protein GlcG (DUF336 family)